ncbi:MAG: enoyl-CoA hydratase/isomerase family protein [Deltaproteobacteria bacterium]|nr:enoyl-CoA hydratase/isomerase family protein [Deltaproteobacteria bacterium]MBT6432097.1 enoyl-CoA hydratase/isomerase family protein [Deltaproteobacteria bacterium]MBT6491822.1 enoyl-CoA hydratase/isomerase family protein [Deltaproteobacteria bacterium]
MTENSYKTLLVTDLAQGVVLCTFNRPDVRNALDISMVEEIRSLLTALTLRDDVRALIFTGAGGKAFISGADIAQLKERGKFDALNRINSALFREIEQFQWPTIAAIDGYALGGGCELAMACDIRIATQKSKLGQPEVSLGIIPGAGATYRLPRLVGQGMARELIYTGRIIDAQTAADIGLINRVVEAESVMSAATELAEEIARNSALALRFAKLSLNNSLEASPEACMAYESTAQALLFEDEEKHARMGKFLERRKAKK